jgi:membrane associated rhomboid family serine protease
MAIHYDPSVIVQFAESLYARARSLIIGYAFFGLVVGIGMGQLPRFFLHYREASEVVGSVSVVGAIVGVIVGVVSGSNRSFQMRLQAQTALCQLQTEINTRARS